MKRRATWLLCAVLTTATASARPPASSTPPKEASLLDRVGLQPLERALRSGTSAERERAFARLGEFGTTRALELLIRALDANGAAQSPRERLVAVRVLANHVREANVRECLVRVMTGISTSAERAEPLQGLLRDTAALALVRGGPLALEALGRALKQSGRVAQAAAAALVAHPPDDLSALVRAHLAPTPELVEALEQLGDERAFELLRDIVRRGTPELRGQAAVALTRLGNFETVALAKRWLTPNTPLELLLAALEILLLADERVEPSAVARLLQDEGSRARALALLTSAPGATRDALLIPLLSQAERRELPSIIAALGASGGPQAMAALAQLGHGESADAAAYALSLSPAPYADTLLAHWLTQPESRRRAARAAALRVARSGGAVAGLTPTLETLLRSNDSRDRAVGAFGLALQDRKRAAALLADKDPVIVQAAARVAPFVGAARVAAWHLVNTTQSDNREQLAIALLDPEARAEVPTQMLLDLATANGAAAPIAWFALGARDAPSLRDRLLTGLGSPDPLVRAQTALGLAESRDPSALGVLENAYRFEFDGNVRRAIVQAIARRPERVRRRALELARWLDPDPQVREIARLAASGVTPTSWTGGHAALWLATQGGSKMARAVVRLPGGLAVPVLADPEGVIALSRLPEGPVSISLALPAEERNAAGEGH